MQAVRPKNSAAGRAGVINRHKARVHIRGADSVRPVYQAERRSHQRTQRQTFSGIARIATGIIVHVFHTFLILFCTD